MAHNPMPLAGVEELARLAGRPVAVLDLETTGFTGASNFGITEIAFLKVSPNGEQSFFETLVNPENYFPEDIQALTGISEREVLGRASFAQWAQAMRRLLEETLLVGFNARTSDIPGLCSQMLRYGCELPRPGVAMDLRDAWRGIHRPERGRGKLIDVATHYGCAFTGAHRAMADVKGTAMALNAMLLAHGPAAVRAFETPTHAGGKASEAPAAMKAPAKEKAPRASSTASRGRYSSGSGSPASSGSDRAARPSRDAQKKAARQIALDLLAQGAWDLQKAVATVGDAAALSFALADLLSEGAIAPRQVACPLAQQWLGERWPAVSEGANGYLKPMLQKAQSLGCPGTVDYIQLRVAILTLASAPSPSPRAAGPR